MLIVNGQPLKARSNETILDTIERYNIPIYSECRNGFCGSCRLLKVKGEAIYIDEPLAFTSKNELIACVSKPLLNSELILTC